ncbi:MAG: hypothetical protein AAF602_09620 [Myxococcota bacterium]
MPESWDEPRGRSVDDTGPLLADSDPHGPLVIFPEDRRAPPRREPPLPLLDPETGPLEPERAPLPRMMEVERTVPRLSEMPTVRPGPSPFGDVAQGPTVIASRPMGPVKLPTRQPRPRNIHRRAGLRLAPAAPGDVRAALRNSEHQAQRGRIYIWLAAWVLLIGIPAMAVPILVPDLWPFSP